MKSPLVWFAAAVVLVVGVVPAMAMEYRLEGSVAAYHWVEDLGSLEVEETGPVLQFGGYVSGFPSTSIPALTLRGDFRLLVGQVEFDTFDQDLISGTLTPVTTDTTYLGTTQEGALGLRETFEKGFLETFVGLGYRWWWRDIGGATGYPEYYQQIYGRVGLRIEHDLGDTLKFRSTVSIDPLLWARETIDLTDIAYIDSGSLVEGQQVTVENGLNPGWTFEIGLRQGTIDLTGYWQAVRLDVSNAVTCFDSTNPAVRQSCFQPESHQDIFGLRLGLAF